MDLPGEVCGSKVNVYEKQAAEMVRTDKNDWYLKDRHRAEAAGTSYLADKQGLVITYFACAG